MAKNSPKTTMTRTYTVPIDLYDWIKQKAAAEKRAVIRQVEIILEDARQKDLEEKG